MACNADAEDQPWLTFFWNIENYSYYRKKEGEHICSPTFEVESIEHSKWYFYLHAQESSDEIYISYDLYGSLSEETREVISVEFELAILTEEGSVLQIKEREGTSYRSGRPGYLEAFALRKEVIKREAFLSNDTLRTRCRLWRTDGKAAASLAFLGRTAMKVERWNFLQNVSEFSSLEYGQRAIYLSEKYARIQSHKLRMEVNKEDKLIIHIVYSSLCVTFLTVQLFIRDRKRRETDCGKREIWPDEKKKEAVYILPFTKTYLTKDKDLFLEDDALSLFCEISLHDGQYPSQEFKKLDSGNISPFINDLVIPNSYVSDDEVLQSKNMSGLKEDFECLYSKGILSDVKLRTASEAFQAHKNILSARSPVFLAMFTTDMKESMQDYVDVSDLEDDTVRRMLLYVYTDILKDLQWESALKLYAAADKYQLVTLKVKCCCFLKRNLCSRNVCDLLCLADLHGDGELKKAAQDYVLAHEEDVFSSDKWAHFFKNNGNLAAETMLLKWKRKPKQCSNVSGC
ncbi:speckle-type POZ protein B [Trichonephila clavipes]|nr:speckle-type POZ protein B [Trichonephila clavipes]